MSLAVLDRLNVPGPFRIDFNEDCTLFIEVQRPVRIQLGEFSIEILLDI